MEMPKNCEYCKFNFNGCIFEKNADTSIADGLPYDCPLVEIVTCKDCKNYLHIDGHDHLDYCDQHGCVSSNHYCADAERRK
jgi:hypothetical protein